VLIHAVDERAIQVENECGLRKRHRADSWLTPMMPYDPALLGRVNMDVLRSRFVSAARQQTAPRP